MVRIHAIVIVWQIAFRSALRTKLGSEALYNVLILVADGAPSNHLYKKNEEH